MEQAAPKNFFGELTMGYKVAVAGAVTVLLEGCTVMIGAALTVRVAVLLVMLPATLVTMTEYKEPSSPMAVADVV